MALAVAEMRRNYDQGNMIERSRYRNGSRRFSRPHRVGSFSRHAPMPNGSLGNRTLISNTGISASGLRRSSKNAADEAFGPQPGHESA